MPAMTTILPMKTYNPSHNGRVCSTWGAFHYKTFDGDIFRFPGLCNYIFSSHCKSAYEDFNIQVRRSPGPNATTTVSHITLKLEGTVVEMSPAAILVNGKPVQLPFSQSGILIENSSSYVKVTAKLGLEFMWNQDDGLLLELDAKYANQTCGLCGDFNGIPTYSEFFSNNVRLTAVQFGNMQKMDGPTEQCLDPLPTALHNCTDAFDICETTLNSAPFFTCHALVNVSSYVEACRQDSCLCDKGQHSSCICSTLAEYSRQCAYAGGQPMNWRAPDLCPKTCHLNMQYHECSSPCMDTCSNPDQSALCEEHCMDGCFCPSGTVFDDIGSQGCVPVSQCFCVHSGQSYAPGAFRSTECTNCTCSGGQWSCQDLPCPGTCSVTGGSHFSTFDDKHYTVHGDCSYVLVKPCDDKAFAVLTELRKCGLTDSETCLKSVSLSIGSRQTVIVVKSTGEVFVNSIYSQLPVSAGNATLFRPSSSFIIAQTNLGLQLTIQLIPIMQIFVRLEPSLRGLTCGLCGNFNSIQADDFKTMSGVVEGTAAAFVNTYKTQANCPNIKNHFEDPCTLSVENEKYAQHWCGLLTDTQGLFAKCHAVVSPSIYHSNCMFDTCNCEKSEDCLCAALSSYVQACAARGVLLSGWRAGVCTKSVTSCPKSLMYHYNVTTCQPTCRSLSEPDVTCSIKFGPVDGCTCQEGTFMDDKGKCVPAASCPCYYQGSAVPNGESVHDNGDMCTCTQGRLNCIGGQVPKPACAAPMVYFNCSKASAGATGAECQKSCHTLDMHCYSSQCVSGCMCPDGLVSDGEGGCVHKDQCPCVHNEARYHAGETIQVECNTCTCKNQMWQCTNESCLATCAVYGDGHYITFDGQRYSFNGDCEYTLVQDRCGKNISAKGTFRVITENIPCGTTGTTCSKTIKIFFGGYELKLSEGKVEVIEKKGAKGEPPYSIHQKGIYLIVDTNLGLVLLWDKKTSIFIQLSPDFKGKVCGLCGNYDGNSMNDFTTRSLSVVGDVQEFGTSWKMSPSCPDAGPTRDPCTANPYRKAWAQKQCSIINSAIFATCHPHVEPTRYYEACVSDACACDTGGDCECFCTAVAAYAQACNEINVCVSWRTPSICPLFCDYYNPNGSCEWHYQPCGAPCMRTCHNPSGKCSHNIRGLEGCYPKCPPKTPIFDEDKMECVQSCAPCYIEGRYYPPGSPVPSDKNCQSCSCTEAGIKCTYDSKACICTYKGKSFLPGDIIYNTTDGTGGCIIANCSANGTIEGTVHDCTLTTSAPSTTFAFSDTTTPVPTVTRVNTKRFTISATNTSITTGTSFESVSTPGMTSETTTCDEVCTWSPWLDVSHPGSGANSGDFDTLENIRAEGYRVCRSPKEVECRSAEFPAVPWQDLNQTVECSRAQGLICHNTDQVSGKCDNYHIRILCCFSQPCTRHKVTALTTAAHSGSTVAHGTSISRPPTTPEPKGISGNHLTKSTATPSTRETKTITKLSPSPETPGTSSHSPDVTPRQVTMLPLTNSCLREVCEWTPWIDGSYPESDINGGDFDTFKDLRAKGYKFCEVPTAVECRAESFPNTPLNELEQNVTCSKTEGLLCLNKDQLPPICYNYEIRIQCCSKKDFCHSGGESRQKNTTSPTQPPRSSGVHSTRTERKPTETPSCQRHVPPPHANGKPSSPPTATTAETASQSPAPSCQPQCSWTKWFDVDFPSSGPNGGDVETYNNIMARGEKICHQPEYITRLECRAENYPHVNIEKIGQVVECNADYGLICRNQDQKGTFKTCFNYEIRVLCCEPMKNCPNTTATSANTPITTSVTTKPSPETTSHVVATTSNSVPSSPTTTITAVPTSHAKGKPSSPPTATTAETAIPSPAPSCQPQCSWTKWFDVDFPSSGPNGGDVETYNNIIARGEKICHQPEYITRLECRAENYPHANIEKIGQVVECNADYGLICRNQDQKGTFKTCFNYEIRVLCCEPMKNCPNTTATSANTPITTSVTTKPSPETTSHVVATTSNSVPSSPTTTITAVPTSHAKGKPSSPPTATTAETASPSPAPSCQPQCSWTKWFDVDVPSSGPNGGDVETYNNIMARGEKICHQPEYITRLECRAENYPHVNIEKIGQVVECNADYGLICRNQDQKGTFKTCFNYEIRVLCCEPMKNCPNTTATSANTPITTSVTTKPSPETTSHVVATTSNSVPSSPTTTITAVPTSHAKGKPSSPLTATTAETASSSPTPSCQPQCSWTKWFDVDFPSSGPNGGDVETYNNIIGKGEKICQRPEYITRLQCRSENHPHTEIEKIGQVVECNPDYGLICRNQDQEGTLKMCLNYEIRVLCCEPVESCPLAVSSSSFPPSISKNASATTSAPNSMFPPVRVSTSFTTLSPQSSSSCYCFLSGKVYRSGTLIYNQTDHTGHCYSALCNKDCSVRRIATICPTSAPAPVLSQSSSTSASAATATVTATSSSTLTLPSASSSLSPVTPTKSRDCLNAVPPRKKGETWSIHKCKKATCEGDDVITLTPVSCPAVKKMSCANGYPPVKVYDDAEHCCYHYECQCVCSGWGDPHYITFDGVYYTFLDNCTYVLVQQIHSVYDHFRVLIDNYFCGARDGLSCPRSITVEYKGNRVVLIRTLVHGVMENEVIFNNRTVSAGFKKDGIVISTLGIKMFVTIPEIGVQVMFSGLLFSVEVPFTKFGNNTEGQCGTCTNDKKDECRLPDGKIVSSCSQMSGSWKYHVPNQPYCYGPSPTPTPTIPSRTTPKSCPPSLLCKLIMSKVFEACHHVIPPEPYFEGCVYDQCHIPEGRVWCSGLELYASLCAAQGVCIEWRHETQGQCSLTCPGNKAYQACGPIYPHTCQNPQGSINTSLIIADDISLLTEGCFCPNGTTLFSSNSNICVPATPLECHTWCTGPSGEPVEPGAAVSSGPCETCSCVPDSNPESKTYVIKCEAKVCDTHCPVGSKYQERSGQCCGECVQVACVVQVNDSSVQLVQPGKTWSRPGNKCVQYECEEVNGQLILVTVKKACPPTLCSPDQVRRSEDGCCLVCPSPSQVYPCAMGRHTQVIRKGSCNSSTPLEVTYCQGNCGDTMSIYSFEANVVEHRCQCCRELRTSQRNVSLSCPDGSHLAFAFTQVEECGCQSSRCDSLDIKSSDKEDESAPSQEQGTLVHQDEQSLHRRRAAPSSQPRR
uniref:Mucin-5AC n=1 Tax=Phascolarctos cinereus TaxID=38626 RepID=A0A6P5J697_PHACI|nr:mucin-5AC [Phascolarctos cinereus]